MSAGDLLAPNGRLYSPNDHTKPDATHLSFVQADQTLLIMGLGPH